MHLMVRGWWTGEVTRHERLHASGGSTCAAAQPELPARSVDGSGGQRSVSRGAGARNSSGNDHHAPLPPSRTTGPDALDVAGCSTDIPNSWGRECITCEPTLR